MQTCGSNNFVFGSGCRSAWKLPKDCPTVALPLLSHLFESGEKEKLLVLAEQALAAKESTWQDKYFDLNNYYDKDDLVAKVRRILAKVYVNPEERDKRIDNYEKLF